jgi:hypothetical protein
MMLKANSRFWMCNCKSCIDCRKEHHRESGFTLCDDDKQHARSMGYDV